MPQTARQKAIIIRIKKSLGAGERSKEKIMKESESMGKTNSLRRLQERKEFLNKKLKLAQSGKTIFKKDLTISAQSLEQVGVA